mgnify:CR=1 FL=1
MHPSASIRSLKSRALEGKRIVLGITGSIAAVESFELARELIRHGAEVHTVMTPEALKLVTPWAMQFATGNEVVTEIDGRVQHVSLLGDYPDKADLLLIAPCTANTLSKVALGIDDTTVTTMATVALGSGVPVLVAPAMHLAMFNHPMVRQNTKVLGEMGVEFIGPHTVGKKARIASVEDIVMAVLRRLGRRDLEGKRILVIGGSSEEPIDRIRVVTNNGTGETAVRMATAAFLRGADVELWAGRMLVPVPQFLKSRRFTRVEDLLDMVEDIDHDAVIVPAALSDYAPVAVKDKIPSGRKELEVKMKGLPKVLPAVRKKAGVVVGFKAEVGVSEQELVRRARVRLEEHRLDMIVANDFTDVREGVTKAILVTAESEVPFEGSKSDLSDRVLDEVLGRL